MANKVQTIGKQDVPVAQVMLAKPCVLAQRITSAPPASKSPPPPEAPFTAEKSRRIGLCPTDESLG